MNIENISPVGQGIKQEAASVDNRPVENESSPVANQANQPSNTNRSMSYDEASGLMQSILSDKISEDVIRKMPPDDYLKLMNLLDKMMSGSVDRRV